MLFPSISSDDYGHSFLTQAELAESGDDRRKGTPSQTIKYWQLVKYMPGHFADFATVDEIQLMSVVSGRLELTMSNGDKYYVSRGDMMLLRDTHGQGHCTRVLGSEPCQALMIAMNDLGDFKT